MSLFERYYDRAMEPIERRVLLPWRTALIAQASNDVLEIGIGTGVNLPLYPSHCHITGIDPSAAMLEIATKRETRASLEKLVLGFAEALPFPDAQFDTVVGTLVLCSVNDALTALLEIHRVLKPGGRLLLLEHVLVPHPFASTLQHALTPVWSRMCGGCHLNRDTPALVRSFFPDVHATSYTHGLFVSLTARKALG